MAAAPIDIIGEDLLQNIVGRLPATSFASAACVNRCWNVVCERVLSRPKLSSACSFNPSLQVAVEEVLNKVLSQPIRPHFAIVSVCGSFDLDDEEDDPLEAAHDLITTTLGSQVPVITNSPLGIIGRDAFSDEIKEIQCKVGFDPDVITLIIGFLPGMKVTTIPLSKQFEEPNMVMIDEFVTDIRKFSTYVSGSQSPATIIVFPDYEACMIAVMEKLDYALSPDTVIVGDNFSRFRCTSKYDYLPVAVAIVFAVDRNKPPAIGKTQFHAVLSSGLSPVGPTYKATSVIKKNYCSRITARREGSLENLSSLNILNPVYDMLGDRIENRDLYIGVTKKRTCSIGQEKVGCITSFAFHNLCGFDQKYLFVDEDGIKNNDTFRFYLPDSTVALSSAAVVSSHMRSFNNTTSGGDKQEVFGGIIFTCCGEGLFRQPNIDSSLFSDNLPGVTLGGIFCYNSVIGRPVLTPYVKESQVRCCIHPYSAVYLVMSYTPSKRN